MKKIALLIVLMLSGGLDARAGGVHIEGGGLAESNFAFAYINLDSFLATCLKAASPCALTDPEKELANELHAALPAEYATAEQLRFKTDADDPGFFGTAPNVATYRTETEVGALLWINRDLIYTPGVDGKIVAMTMPEAAQILIQALSEHQGAEGQLGTSLARRVVGQVVRQQETLAWGVVGWNYIEPARRPTITAVHTGSGVGATSHVYLSDPYGAYELTDVLAARIRCADQSKPVGLFAYNMHWSSWNYTWQPLHRETLTLETNVVYYCDAALATPLRRIVSATLVFAFETEGRHFVAAESSQP